MSILDKIIAQKHREIEALKTQFPRASDFEKMPRFGLPRRSLRAALVAENSSGIIAEFKKKSPSKGDIAPAADVESVCQGYHAAGAAAMSVLTDAQFFGGHADDLCRARDTDLLPLLRKDFIVDERQILHARALGADAILLIGECLEARQVRDLARFARSLELEVLFEIHAGRQLEKLVPDIHLVGVNNRDLATFEVSVGTSQRLNALIPSEFLRVSESGIDSPEVVAELRRVGFRGFLIGEFFMRQPDPGAACAAFISGIRNGG
ncbi:MAG: indole-3-glycerol phosphate synthase TrpC [Saprospiraceae bacterium]